MALEGVLDSGSVVSSGPGELRLLRFLELDSASKASGSLVVEYQVGTVDTKRLFVAVRVPESALARTKRDLHKALVEMAGGAPRKLPDGSVLLVCRGEWVCVKTCPKPGGGEFCCKWECEVGG